MQLTNNQLYVNLALEVCVPYLRNKCDVYIDQLEMKSKLQLKEVISNVIMIWICVQTDFIFLESIYNVKKNISYMLGSTVFNLLH